MAESYRVPMARLYDWPHPHPERTAYIPRGTGMDFDWTCQVWPNRPAMLRGCAMSEIGVLSGKFWRPLIKPKAKA